MNPSDTELQRRLQASLQHSPPPDAAATQALQDRVMAQWAQRHAAQLAWQTASAGGPTDPEAARRTRRQRWGLAALALGLVLAVAWINRPDPALEELLQPDVLQLITLGSI